MSVPYKIGEAAALLNLKTYVLRFWETEFPQIVPLRTEKGQRLYTEDNLALLDRIRFLLHERGLTIEGARKVLAEEAGRGVRYVRAHAQEQPEDFPASPHGSPDTESTSFTSSMDAVPIDALPLDVLPPNAALPTAQSPVLSSAASAPIPQEISLSRQALNGGPSAHYEPERSVQEFAASAEPAPMRQNTGQGVGFELAATPPLRPLASQNQGKAVSQQGLLLLSSSVEPDTDAMAWTDDADEADAQETEDLSPAGSAMPAIPGMAAEGFEKPHRSVASNGLEATISAILTASAVPATSNTVDPGGASVQVLVPRIFKVTPAGISVHVNDPHAPHDPHDLKDAAARKCLHEIAAELAAVAELLRGQPAGTPS